MSAGDMGEYVVPVGKWRGKPLKEIRSTDLLNYCNYVQKVASRDKKTLNGPMLELMIVAHAYLGIPFNQRGK